MAQSTSPEGICPLTLLLCPVSCEKNQTGMELRRDLEAHRVTPEKIVQDMTHPGDLRSSTRLRAVRGLAQGYAKRDGVGDSNCLRRKP